MVTMHAYTVIIQLYNYNYIIISDCIMTFCTVNFFSSVIKNNIAINFVHNKYEFYNMSSPIPN